MRIATIYPVIGIYRVPVFSCLFHRARDLGHSHEFYADPINPVDSVELADFKKINDSTNPQHFVWRDDLRNHTWGKWLWQTGAIRLSLRTDIDTIIFLGVCWHISTWIAAILARLSGKKVLMWTHGFYGTENFARKLFRSAFLRIAHHVMFYGNHARNIAIKNGFSSYKTSVIYNSLDVTKQIQIRSLLSNKSENDLRKKIFKNSDLPLLIFIGRLIPEKKLEILIYAMHKLNTAGTKTNAIIIGTGPEKARLVALSEKLGLFEYIHFYGKCYEEVELAPLIAMSDLCVTPGSIGLTCMHSMIYGTPVITHDDPNTQGPEYEAVIPNKTGLFFRKGDVEDLALVISKWLHAHPNKDQVRDHCYAEVEQKWTPNSMTHAINKAIGIEL